MDEPDVRPFGGTIRRLNSLRLTVFSGLAIIADGDFFVNFGGMPPMKRL